MPSKAHLMALASGETWLENGSNLLLFGPPGCGKTHASPALGRALIESGYRVLLMRTTDLVQHLQAARQTLQLGRTSTRPATRPIPVAPPRLSILRIRIRSAHHILYPLTHLLGSPRRDGPAAAPWLPGCRRYKNRWKAATRAGNLKPFMLPSGNGAPAFRRAFKECVHMSDTTVTMEGSVGLEHSVPNCPICGEHAQINDREIRPYKMGINYRIRDCQYCDLQYVDELNAPVDLYDQIYANSSRLPGYDRYSYFQSEIASKTDPLRWLGEHEPAYWFIQKEIQKLPKTASILEVGSGLGYLTYSIKNRG